jgi:thiosulfate/3-mercaptopyruvate sulfurtransferase
VAARKNGDLMTEFQSLISSSELAALDQTNLRIFDCTTYLEPPPPGSGAPYEAVSGRQTFEEAHIPGADFLDLQGEFSDTTAKYHFMMPATSELEATFGRHGIGADTFVVIYSRRSMMWATRIWWMLRALGFDDVAELDGGFDKWQSEGRPTESGPPRGYPAAAFTAALRPGLFVDKDATFDAIDSRDTVIVNALGPQFYQGLEPSRYGRSGRVPGSVNVPSATLIDPDDEVFAPASDAEARFKAAGVTSDKRVICYCGGGISATLDLFMLHCLGYENLSLYDGSMAEWATDPSLPIETD